MTEDPTPQRESELIASLKLLRASLTGGVGLVGVSAVALLLVVRYHPEFAVRAGLVSDDWRYFGWVALNIICLLLVPILVIKLGLRENLSAYGFGLGEWRIWARHGALYLVIVLPVIAIASRAPSFRQFYPMFQLVRDNALLLIPWELAYGAYFFAWEFFFRGFLLQGLAKRFGAAAIVIQTIPFVMMHFRKPEPEAAASVIAGIALGITAYRSRSFIGCWLVHWICAATMDLLALAWGLPHPLA